MAIRIRNRIKRKRLVENLLRAEGDRIAEVIDEKLVRRDSDGVSKGSYRRQPGQERLTRG